MSGSRCNICKIGLHTSLIINLQNAIARSHQHQAHCPHTNLPVARMCGVRVDIAHVPMHATDLQLQ